MGVKIGRRRVSGDISEEQSILSYPVDQYLYDNASACDFFDTSLGVGLVGMDAE